MATAIVNDKVSRFQVFNFILSMTIVGCFLMILLKDHTSFLSNAESEIVTAKSNITNEQWVKIDQDTKKMHAKYFIDSGVYETFRHMLIPAGYDGEQVNTDDVLSQSYYNEWGINLVKNMQVLAYQIFHRINIFKLWLFLLIPLSVALVMTGYYKWKIKLFILGGANANKARIWLKVSWITFLLTLLYLLVPNMLSVLSFYSPAALVVIASVTISNLISNYHKS